MESGAKKKKIPGIYDQLVFDKVAKIIQCGKDSLFNSVKKTGYSHGKE